MEKLCNRTRGRLGVIQRWTGCKVSVPGFKPLVGLIDSHAHVPGLIERKTGLAMVGDILWRAPRHVYTSCHVRGPTNNPAQVPSFPLCPLCDTLFSDFSFDGVEAGPNGKMGYSDATIWQGADGTVVKRVWELAPLCEACPRWRVLVNHATSEYLRRPTWKHQKYVA